MKRIVGCNVVILRLSAVNKNNKYCVDKYC